MHVSGYGQFGPSKNKPSYDVSGQAMGGYMYMNGVSPTSGPLKVNPYLSDYITAYNACMVALAGYINAKNSGEGDSCDVAQYDTMFRLLDNYPANWFNKGYPKQGEPVPFRTGNKSDQAACFSFYDTKEGNAMFVAIVGQGPVTRGYPIIGMGKPGVTEGIPKNCTGFPLFDPRGKKADELCAKFCAEHTCDEIEEIFNKAGIPCQRAYGPADIEKDPQYEARENIVEWVLRQDEGHRRHEHLQEEPVPDRGFRAVLRRAQPRGSQGLWLHRRGDRRALQEGRARDLDAGGHRPHQELR